MTTIEALRYEADSFVVCGGMASLLRKAAAELEALQLAAGFCEKHKPNGGARNCLVCGCENLSHALDQISYAVGEPNEMRVSNYSTSYDEDEVVGAVKSKLEALQGDFVMAEDENKNLRSQNEALQGEVESLSNELALRIGDKLEITSLRDQNQTLLELLKDVLKSSDVLWYEKQMGHDWKDCIDRIKQSLAQPPEGKS